MTADRSSTPAAPRLAGGATAAEHAAVRGLKERVLRVLALVDALRFRSMPLRHQPPIEQDSDAEPGSRAVGWLGPVTVAGRTHHALLCRPNASTTIRVQSAAGGTLAAHAAVLPEAWNRAGDAVEFVLSARSEDGSWSGQVVRHLDPSRRSGDRRWRPLRLAVPPVLTGHLRVTFATRRRGGPSEPLPAVWGDPKLAWPRAARELAGMARGALRQHGLKHTVARLRDYGGHDEERARFERWLDLNTPTAEALAAMASDAGTLARRPVFSIITPVHNTDPRWLTACIESVRRQVYPHWELCIADDASTSAATRQVLAAAAGDPRIKIVRLASNRRVSGASNAALAQASGDFVAMLDHDDELAPEALYEVARRLNEEPDADFIYSDEDKLDGKGRRSDPYFKPDWSPELFRSFNYTNHFTVLRRSLVEAVGGFREGVEGSQDYDLALRVTERTGRVVHIPKILYHWRKVAGSAAADPSAKPWALESARRALNDHLQRSGLDAEAVPGSGPGLFRVKHAVGGRPLVSLIVLTADATREVEGRERRLLVNGLRSVVSRTGYSNYEILIVDEGRLSEQSAAFLATVPHRRVSCDPDGPFNFAERLNTAVGHARGDHLLFFNDDLEVIGGEWMQAMLEFSQQPGIGAVGAKLLLADGRLQHVGMVLGVAGVAAHAFHMAPAFSPGYAGSAQVIRNCSAVTAACMMTRRAVFEEAGGFNTRLAVDFNDVDYCLRVRQAGYRIVFTPYALLYHFESSSFGARRQSRAETEEMLRLWGPVLERDPYYNPNLTRDFSDHRVRI